MKKQIQNILLIISIGIVVGSCKDDFLSKNNNHFTLETTIYVSPEWGVDSYPVTWANAGNAKYIISDIPEWLMVDQRTGQFINGVAYITCFAIQQKDFSKTGIYNAYLKMEIDGIGVCIVPVGYVNEGNPMIECLPEVIILGETESYQPSFSVRNDGDGILLWQVVESPNWIKLSDSTGFVPSFSSGYVPVNLKPGSSFANDTTGRILITNNSRNNQKYALEVQYKAVAPRFTCFEGTVEFGREAEPKTVSFFNQSNGTLVWNVDQCPDWITVSKQRGTLTGFEEERILLTCNRTGLTVGSHAGTIRLLTNDKNTPSYSINVTCWAGEGNPEFVTAIEGTVIDVDFDKSSEILYIITQNPNQLIAYQFATKTITNTLVLDRAPACLSITEDGKKAITGHDGYVNYFDLSNFSLLKSLTTDFLVHDGIVVNNWCLLSSQQHAVWLDIETGVISSFLNEGYPMIFKKIYNKDIILGHKMNVYPGGVFYIDTQTRTLKSYFHSTIFPFWASQDGEYIFNGQSNVYRTSTFFTTELSPIGYLQNHGDYFYDWVGWVDHNPATNSLWVLENPYWNELSWNLAQYETKNYTFVKSYNYSDYVTTINGVSGLYQTTARYVFANKDGTEIYVIKNVIHQDAWSVEIIPIN